MKPAFPAHQQFLLSSMLSIQNLLKDPEVRVVPRTTVHRKFHSLKAISIIPKDISHGRRHHLGWILKRTAAKGPQDQHLGPLLYGQVKDPPQPPLVQCLKLPI